MDSILIIQGNDVYELDEECLKEKNNETTVPKTNEN